MNDLTIFKQFDKLQESLEQMKKERADLDSIIFDLEKENQQLKDSANEVINAKDIIIRRLNKEIAKYKKVLKYIKANSNKNDFYTSLIYDLADEALKD